MKTIKSMKGIGENMKQIKLVNMTKDAMVNEIKAVNDTVTVNNSVLVRDIKGTIVTEIDKNTKKADITAIVETEVLHPECFTDESDIQVLMHNLCTMITGCKEFTPKNGGSVCKLGRKRVFELYSCSDYRVHMYAPYSIIEKVAKTYKGFAVHNDKWSFTDRYEFIKTDFVQFANDCLLAGEYSVIADMVANIK